MAGEPSTQAVEAIETRLCEICYEERAAPLQFPTFSSCQHPPSTCKSCIFAHMHYRISAEPDWKACVCPSCNQNIPEVELKTALPEAAVKFVDGWIEEAAPILRSTLHHCPANNCDYYALVLDGMGPRLTCPKCGVDSCLTHKTTWHFHYTCSEFDDFLSHTDPDSRTIVLRDTSACPNCRVPSIRAENCDVGGCKYISWSPDEPNTEEGRLLLRSLVFVERWQLCRCTIGRSLRISQTICLRLGTSVAKPFPGVIPRVKETTWHRASHAIVESEPV